MHRGTVSSSGGVVIIAAVVVAVLATIAGDAWRLVYVAEEFRGAPWELVLRAIVYTVGGALVLIAGGNALDRYSQEHGDQETVGLLAFSVLIVASGVAVALGPEF